MKLQIDTAACMAHGRCYGLAPALIDADDQGYPVLSANPLDLSPEHEALGDELVGTCPEGAISLIRE